MGYSNKTTEFGNQIVGASFRNVGQTSFCLNDFRPTGYENSEVFKENGGVTGSDISLMLIDSQGGSAGDFDWRHSYKEGEWQDNARWKGETGETYAGGAELGPDEVFLNPGEGVWLTCSVWDSGLSFSSAGEVIVDSYNVPCAYGNQVVSNPLAKPITLDSIKIVGYQNSEIFKENGGVTGSDISLMLIDAQGGSAGDFDWRHSYKEGEWQDNARWKGETGETYAGGAELGPDEIEIQAGESVWLTFSVWDEGCAVWFPGIYD